MGKKNRKKERAQTLSGTFGQGASGKPLVSKYASKQAKYRKEALEAARAPVSQQAATQFNPPAALPAKQDGTLIPAAHRNSATAMVTGSYRGAARHPASFLSVTMPGLSNPALAAKPCFMVADKRNSSWLVTRYVGDLAPNGVFNGAVDTIMVGPSSDPRVQRGVFSAMIHWAKSQSPEELDRLPQKVFGPSQNIHGQNNKPAPPRRDFL